MVAAAPGRARWIVAIEALALAGFAALWGALLVLGAPRAADAAWAAVLGALLGLVLADLVSGLVHWACDRFGSAATPVLGPLVIAPFREHHRDPDAIAGHGLVEVAGTNALAVVPLLAVAAPGVLAAPGAAGAFAWGGLLGFAGLSAATNAIHLLAHRRRVPRAVAWLQRRRLLLPPEHHARHHRAPHDVAYCITTGWCNPLLDRSGLLRRQGRVPSGSEAS